MYFERKDTPGYTDPINYNHVYVDRGVDYDLRKHRTYTPPEAHHINGILDWESERDTPGSKRRIRFYNDEHNQGYGGTRYLQMKKRWTQQHLSPSLPCNGK